MREALFSYNLTSDYHFEPTKLAIHSTLRPALTFYQIVVIISRRLLLSMTWCTSLIRRTSSPMWILIVVLLSTLKLLGKSNISTESRRIFPSSLQAQLHPQKTINVTVVLMRSISLTSFWTPTIYRTSTQRLL